jgi:hypothetical protein
MDEYQLNKLRLNGTEKDIIKIRSKTAFKDWDI